MDEGSEPETALARARSRLNAVGLELRLVAAGTATVDLDRAEAEARAAMPVRQVSGAADDNLLGARCRLVTTESGNAIVLLEPSTEGRLAAALAKFGEHHAVDYVTATNDTFRAAAVRGVQLSAVAAGPFGRQRLVLGGPRWGPFLVILEQAATIEP